MKRFVLLHRGQKPDPADLAALDKIEGLTVVDNEIPRAMLVEGPESAIAEVRLRLKNWTVAEEVTYPRPDSSEA